MRFRFAIGLGATDEGMCRLFERFLGVGRVKWSARRKPHYDDEVTYTVQAMQELVDVVVPFMDEHLPDSYKREQYVAWRAKLLDYTQKFARRRGSPPCTVEDCTDPVRAHGYCRHHLWVFRRE